MDGKSKEEKDERKAIIDMRTDEFRTLQEMEPQLARDPFMLQYLKWVARRISPLL